MILVGIVFIILGWKENPGGVMRIRTIRVLECGTNDTLARIWTKSDHQIALPNPVLVPPTGELEIWTESDVKIIGRDGLKYAWVLHECGTKED